MLASSTHWDEFKRLISGGTASAGSGEKKLYRVRKRWEDATGQLGAFESLENAKKACIAGQLCRRLYRRVLKIPVLICRALAGGVPLPYA